MKLRFSSALRTRHGGETWGVDIVWAGGVSAVDTAYFCLDIYEGIQRISILPLNESSFSGRRLSPSLHCDFFVTQV